MVQIGAGDAMIVSNVEGGQVCELVACDVSSRIDPFEAGNGFTVPLKTKSGDLISREALIRRKEHPRNRFVGVEIDAAVTVGHGDGRYAGRAQTGVVTSATLSPLLGRMIALARVDVAHAEPRTVLEVGKLDGQQKRPPATVVAPTHYDPKKTRPQD